MAQISLYFDDETAEKLKKAAKMSDVSVSKWVRITVEKSLEKSWPAGYFDLFACIEDSSFQEPEKLNFSDDSKRESFV